MFQSIFWNLFLLSFHQVMTSKDEEMRHFPIYLDTQDTLIVVAGTGEIAAAKIRLLLKTAADIHVYGHSPIEEIRTWDSQGKITLFERSVQLSDLNHCRLVYAGTGDDVEDARVAAIGRSAGAIVNVVDNLEASDFITPAIIDRAPVSIAIGTEGSAPVLARQLKAEFEQQLDSRLGVLARVGSEFRAAAATLPRGRATRVFWSAYYEAVGPMALAEGGEANLRSALSELLQAHHKDADTAIAPNQLGHVWLIGAGPGDPDLLTNKARRALHGADVVIHDRLVSRDVLELARREATFIEVGKTPGGTSWKQQDINQLMVVQAHKGLRVARLKSGDSTIYGRLDEEMDALDAAEISFEIVPGITTAVAAAAKLKVSLTKRERNSELRLLTGHDIQGFADHDWRTLAKPGAVAAIYMGVRAARFLQGRLLMHGADPTTPISIVEHVSRANEATVATTLASFTSDLQASNIRGPAIILFGLSPRTQDQHMRAAQPITTTTMTAMGASS